MTTVELLETLDTDSCLEERLAGLFDDMDLLATGLEGLFSAEASVRQPSPAARRLRRNATRSCVVARERRACNSFSSQAAAWLRSRL